MEVQVKVNVNGKKAPAPKTIYGELDLSVTQLTIGTPLVIGKKYYTDGSVMGDDLSNCGYVQDSLIFIATSTTPTSWINSNIYIQNENVIVYQNNVSPSITVDVVNNNLAKLKITNGGFVAFKTFPNITEGVQVKVIDTNTIEFINPNSVKYFKIEVLN